MGRDQLSDDHQQISHRAAGGMDACQQNHRSTAKRFLFVLFFGDHQLRFSSISSLGRCCAWRACVFLDAKAAHEFCVRGIQPLSPPST